VNHPFSFISQSKVPFVLIRSPAFFCFEALPPKNPLFVIFLASRTIQNTMVLIEIFHIQ